LLLFLLFFFVVVVFDVDAIVMIVAIIYIDDVATLQIPSKHLHLMVLSKKHFFIEGGGG